VKTALTHDGVKTPSTDFPKRINYYGPRNKSGILKQKRYNKYNNRVKYKYDTIPW